MQTKTLFIDFNAVKQHFAKQEEANKDKEITYLRNRCRGLKGEITKLKFLGKDCYKIKNSK